MMGSMRRSTRRPSLSGAANATALVVLASLAALSLLLVPAGALRAVPGAEIVDRIAASIDEVAIAESDVRKAMLVSALPRKPGESDTAYRARVLDALVDQRLQYREALRFAPAAPEPAQIDAAMASLRERIRKAGRDPAEEFAAAHMTPEEVRAALERQIVVQNYLAERFRPIAVADEERAREEYDQHYVPERKAAGAAPEPFESVVEEMRRRSQQRVFDEEAAKWMKEIRQKAAVAIYDVTTPPPAGTPVQLGK